jgi:pimeloyl-ACP methyl ester carboxylesterase
LPFGTLDVAFDPDELRWGDRRLASLTDASELAVTGLRNRYRTPGIGAPLNATTAPLDPGAGFTGLVFPRVKIPITAVLRLANVRAGLASGRLEGSLEVHSADEPSRVEIGGRSVPLEREPTSALADSLSTPFVWKLEMSGFLAGDFLTRMHVHTLGSIEPYRVGRIPVVLVHGTVSSPGRWAQMINDLQNDPSVQRRFQMWAFAYDSGNPIAYSAMLLRRALRDAVVRLDPQGTDPCLRQMVLIGHSQGGLLVKMTAIESGDRLWRDVSDVPIDQVPLSADLRAMLEEALFLEPLPFVRRAVFIATPQRGSYRATAWVSDLVARLARGPSAVSALGAQLGVLRREKAMFASVKRIPTSIDNMSPSNPFIKALAGIPVVPDVPAHSIIGNDSNAPLSRANDGVVAYESAHIEPVESELIVHSTHSMQAKPEVIEEVRRILLLHAARLEATHDSCRPGAVSGEPVL